MVKDTETEQPTGHESHWADLFAELKIDSKPTPSLLGRIKKGLGF